MEIIEIYISHECDCSINAGGKLPAPHGNHFSHLVSGSCWVAAVKEPFSPVTGAPINNVSASRAELQQTPRLCPADHTLSPTTTPIVPAPATFIIPAQRGDYTQNEYPPHYIYQLASGPMVVCGSVGWWGLVPGILCMLQWAGCSRRRAAIGCCQAPLQCLLKTYCSLPLPTRPPGVPACWWHCLPYSCRYRP